MNKYSKLTSLLCSLFLFSSLSQAQEKLSPPPAVNTFPESPVKRDLDYNKQSQWRFTSGEMQSPVNIVVSKTDKMLEDGKITLNYNDSVARVENNGHSIQVSDSGTAIINNRKFELAQFHFHAKSEHTIDGRYFPMEAHFVNVAQDGRMAVIAVFFIEGKRNAGFGEVINDVTKHSHDPITDIQTMFPENKSYYHYLGSLTTPPLIENVEWYVLKHPVEVSKTQIEEFKKLYSHNNREIQKLNDRVILRHDE